jgi:zinc transport system permease protein
MGDISMIDRAYIAGVLIAMCAPFIGSFVVMRRYSLLSDVLAHVSLLGVAVGLATATAPLAISIITVVVASLILEGATRQGRVNSDVVLALMMSGALALSVIIAHFSPKGSYALMGYMFGSLATIDDTQLISVVAITMGVIGVVVIFYRQFVWITLDGEVAQVAGVNVKFVSTVMVVCAAVFIVIAMRLVGGLMIGALLVIPVVAAMNFRLPLHLVILWGVIFSVISMIFGVSASLVYGIPSGAAVVMGSLIIYSITFVISTQKG